MSEFRDPYDQLPKTELLNTTIEVSQRDNAFLRGLFPHRSVLQITINILLSRFVKACKQHELREYDPIRFQSAIAHATIAIDTRRPVTNIASGTDSNKPVEAVSGDVGRGTGEVGHVDPRLPVAASDDDGALASRKRAEKGKKTKGTGPSV
jgi:hypothetical protein